MKEGDKNTGYFQRKATWQKNNNFIIRLKDDKGTWGWGEGGDPEANYCVFLKKLYAKDEGVVPHEVTELLTDNS